VETWFQRLVATGSCRAGAVAVALAGFGWALLCLVLHRAGHAPSVTLLPIEPYYLAQAAFVVPLLFVLWGLCSVVAQRVARALGGSGSGMATANVLGVALAAPLLVLFILPDAVAYRALGFEALATLVRFTAPLSLAATLWLATLALRSAHSLSTPRSFVAGAAGVIAQAALGGILLR
jgi:hypothetical protein